MLFEKNSNKTKGVSPFCFFDFLRAGEETRTLDPQLGRLMLYQLSYARIINIIKDIQVNRGDDRIRTYSA
jgi:hypothetical protein